MIFRTGRRNIIVNLEGPDRDTAKQRRLGNHKSKNTGKSATPAGGPPVLDRQRVVEDAQDTSSRQYADARDKHRFSNL